MISVAAQSTEVAGSLLGKRFVLPFLVVLVLSAAIRFVGLSDLGLQAADQTFYYEVAGRWLDGDSVLSWPPSPNRIFARPAVYAAYAVALAVSGPRDDAIKRLNVVADLAIVALVFFLVARCTGNPAVCTMASLAWALSPQAIGAARGELVHTLSALWILSAWCCLLVAVTGSRSVSSRVLLLMVSGLFVALAGLSHEELYLVAPALALVAGTCGWRRRSRSLLTGTMLFWLPVLLAVGWSVSATSIPVRARFSHELNQLSSAGDASHGIMVLAIASERAARFAWSSLSGLGTNVLPVLFVVVTLVCVLRVPRAQWLVPTSAAALVATYFLGFAVFSRMYLTRWALPLLPIILVACVVGVFEILRFRRGGAQTAGLTTFGLLTVWLLCASSAYGGVDVGSAHQMRSWILSAPSSSGSVNGLWNLMTGSYSTRWARRVFDAVGERVNASARLLVVPSVHDPWGGRRPLETDCYFGPNALYLADHTDDLASLVERLQVRFVLLTNYRVREEFVANRRTRVFDGKRWRGQPNVPGGSVGLTRETYTVDEELQRIQGYLSRRSAALIWRDSRAVPSSELYDLRPSRPPEERVGP